MRVEVLTDRPTERFVKGAKLFREGGDEPLTILTAAPDQPGWRLRFAEIADRTAADALRGAYLEAVVRPEDSLSKGEFYWHEVVGATVRGLNDEELGVVTDVYRAGGAEVFTVKGERFGEFEVPAVRDVIRIFAPRRGEIVVDADALDLQPARPPKPPRPPRPRKGEVSRPRAATAEGADGGDGAVPTSSDDAETGASVAQGSTADDEHSLQPTESRVGGTSADES